MDTKLNLTTMSTQIAESYAIHSSSDIAGSVQDFLADQVVTVSFDQFRLLCGVVSRKVGYMIPTMKVMRMRHAGLEQYLTSLKVG